jgi:ribonuclease T1
VLALALQLRRIALVMAAMAVAGLVSGCGAGRGGSAAPVSGAEVLAPASATTAMRTVTVAQLPSQGVDTLTLIAHGGPYPYPNDGGTFQNREKLLPSHPGGWYEEYTVITPGSSDRGARRIITGQDGSRFYTDDHYASFREVITGSTS